MSRRPHLFRTLRTRFLGGFMLVLLGASTFFVIQVERRRHETLKTQEGDFHEGDVVQIATAIDGDEVSVVDGAGRRTVVRLLGLRTFDPSVNDPQIGRHGQQAFTHIQRLVGAKVKLFPGDPPRDARKRLLAHMESQETQEDIAQRMIQDGLGVAYTEYGHAREAQYLTAEADAMRMKRGVWSDPVVVERIHAQKTAWQERRSSRQ